MAYTRPKLFGELLSDNGILSVEQVDGALQEAQRRSVRMGEVLVSQDLLSVDQVYGTLAEQMDVDYVRLRQVEVKAALRARVSAQVAYHFKCLPLEAENGVMKVAVSDPLDVRLLDNLKAVVGCAIEPVLADEKEILAALQRCYGVGADTVAELGVESSNGAVSRVEVVEDVSDEANVSRLVNQILAQASQARATDVHFEPGVEALKLRYRVDGILQDRPVPDGIRQLYDAVASRIKILAGLNIAEKRLPQDGRFTIAVAEGELDVRVSVIPTPYGEAVNLRFLNARQALMRLSDIGLLERDQEALENIIRKPHGSLFVTGPTGSGKSTTLYACLQKVHDGSKKILTIEDPIEFEISGITQMQVQPKIGLTFASGLRSMLRHDPDVMMVGEVRDPETVEATVRAALTGHLVFSTLHTNDAVGAIPRLLNMDVEPYLLAATVEAIVAQRLVRVICETCKEEVPVPQNAGKSWGLGKTMWQGRGCEACEFTGYRGRTALYEVLVVDEEIRKLIETKAPAGEIRDVALQNGMRRLAQDGMEKVRLGWTTIDEVRRVSQVD